MRRICQHKILKGIIFIALVLFCFPKESISQDNLIKITPIKTFFGKSNLVYERKINQKMSILTDIQFWYLEDKKMESEALSFVVNQPPVLESNDGARISLELRTYRTVRKNEVNMVKIFLGVGGFSGWHDISMVRESYVTQDWRGSRSVAKISGEVENLISSGAHINTGIQFALGQALKFEFGLIAGKAWANQKDDFLTLTQFDPYILEEDRIRYKQLYSKNMDRIFFEPMFLMGVSF